jgi:tetratricopeptide (TPR) repeat protein
LGFQGVPGADSGNPFTFRGGPGKPSRSQGFDRDSGSSLEWRLSQAAQRGSAQRGAGIPARRKRVGRLEELRVRWEKERSSRAFLPLAEEYRRLGRLADAERVCREGLQRHPHYHSARVLLGRTLLELDHLEEAAEEFKAVLEAEPQNLLAGRLLAGIHRNQGRWSEALETFRRLQAFYPDDADVRAQVYQLERGPEEDESRVRLEREGDSVSLEGPPLATNTLAEIFLGQGLVDRAVAVYENMLRADPDNQGVRRRIAEILAGEPARTAPRSSPPPPPRAEEAPPEEPVLAERRMIQGLQDWLITIQGG